VVACMQDPNPLVAGKGFESLRKAGISVASGILEDEAKVLNEAFAKYVRQHTPLITLKSAMTLDGKIATPTGESRWITSEASREFAMNLRLGADAILAGINTVLSDDPMLTVRTGSIEHRRLRRIVLDSMARTPLGAKVVSDEFAGLTTIVVSRNAPKNRIAALAKRVNVLIAPAHKSKIDLHWLLKKLGSENVTSLLVEGGGEVNAAFLAGGLAQRVAFFYAPKVLGGRDSRKGVAGNGAEKLRDIIELEDIEWRKTGPDLFMTARVKQGR